MMNSMGSRYLSWLQSWDNQWQTNWLQRCYKRSKSLSKDQRDDTNFPIQWWRHETCSQNLSRLSLMLFLVDDEVSKSHVRGPFHLAVVSTHDSLTECFNLPCVCYSGYLSMLLLFLMSLLLPFVFRLDLERSMLIWLRIIIMYTNTITLWTVVYEVICERLFSRILH